LLNTQPTTKGHSVITNALLTTVGEYSSKAP
jgi:hypothetical protein